MSINYTPKINELSIPQTITNESHSVGIFGTATYSSGQIRLIQVPQGPGPAVTVTGSGGPYNEILTGSPTGGQFLVNYTTGVVTFATAQNGNTVLVSYHGLGSEIAAEDVNELQNPLNAIATQTLTYISPFTSASASWTLAPNVVITSSISPALVLPLINIQPLSASIVPITDGSGIFTSSSTTTTQLGFLDATSSIQTQLNSKLSTAVLSIHADSNANLVGNVQLVSGTNITLSQSGQAITINSTGSLSATLSNTHIFVGNVSNVATDVAMSGDVTITNAGVTTVGSVGGSSSTNIHSAELLANASTALDTPSTIVKRDGSGNFATSNITLNDQGSIIFNDTQGTPSSIILQAPTTVSASYSLNLPIAQGSSGQTLSNDGTGILSWVTPAGATYTAGTGLTLTGSAFSISAPVSVALGGTNSTAALANGLVIVSSAGSIIESLITTTQLDFLSGVTSNIQSQLNSKQSTTLADTNILVGNGSNVATAVALSGDATLADTGALTLATVNSNVGSFTNANITVNAKGLITAASSGSASGVATSFQILSSDPGSPTTGETWFNSTDTQFKAYNGSSIVILG